MDTMKPVWMYTAFCCRMPPQCYSKSAYTRWCQQRRTTAATAKRSTPFGPQHDGKQQLGQHFPERDFQASDGGKRRRDGKHFLGTAQDGPFIKHIMPVETDRVSSCVEDRDQAEWRVQPH